MTLQKNKIKKRINAEYHLKKHINLKRKYFIKGKNVHLRERLEGIIPEV